MNKRRIRRLNTVETIPNSGPIVYWMNRDQRLYRNWAVVYGLRLAATYNRRFCIVVSLRSDLRKHSGTRRLVDFMLTGLESLESNAQKYGIGFFYLDGDPAEKIPEFLKENNAAVLINDFSPLETPKKWKAQVAQKISIPFYEVDTHNIVPCWITSPKQEYAARTIRPKIHKNLDEFLDEFPQFSGPEITWKTPKINWLALKENFKVDESVVLNQFESGEKIAQGKLGSFIQHYLSGYAEKRNDPSLNHLSHLSPYLHFGQLSSQHVALSVQKANVSKEDKEAFLEELIVRKELSDNYCFYNKDYKSFEGFPLWAQTTLDEHRSDPREFLYTKEEFEKGLTHDSAWNAAQLELVKTGKMHGYMRMYWAKKILEWTKSPEQALEWAIYLNDKYSLDGRDPNGYVGIAWAIGGVHDRAWTERDVLGKIRYMNYNGLKRKFALEAYIERVDSLSF